MTVVKFWMKNGTDCVIDHFCAHYLGSNVSTVAIGNAGWNEVKMLIFVPYINSWW